MPEILYVTRVYEVRIPDDRTEVNASIDAVQPHAEDAEIVKNSDEAIAVHMTYQFDKDETQWTDVDIIDTQVRDVPPNIEEFGLIG